jgi:zinc protease
MEHKFSIVSPGPENAEKLISALKELKTSLTKPDEKDVAKFKEGELADFRKTVKKIDTGYQTTRSYQ